nr:hypothetical protein [Tanacetum cinerariifolium]GFA23047.1 hypothetical protein [Tanacetum cinerariifolium]
ASTGPSTQAQDDTFVNIVRDSPSLADAKTEIGAASENTNNREKTDELDQGQARSEPGRTPESRPPPEQLVMDEDQARSDPGKSRRAIAGPDPEPTHDEFMAELYPKVQESLKLPADEHVILEEPLSLSRTLSSIKNLNDTYTIRDQFINDKSTKDEPELRDLPHKIDEAVWKLMKEHSMKLLRRPWNGHIGTNFFAKKDKSRKRRRNDQDPPPTPLLDLDLSKRTRHNTATTYQAPAENSLLEKTGDMRKFMHCKGSGQALLISKMKAACYLNFGLELLVPEHMWINKVVRTHMHILSVVSIKVFYRYGYDYLKEITLRRVDYQEYTIVEKDFKSLYPSDFEDLNLLLLQGHLHHLSGSDKRMLSSAVKLWIRNLVIRQRVKDFQLGIESYQKQMNITKPGWDAKGFEYKHDYTIIDLPRAVLFPLGNNERKIMRFNEIYKFSDCTLTNIMKALDFRVKEYK